MFIRAAGTLWNLSHIVSFKPIILPNEDEDKMSIFVKFSDKSEDYWKVTKEEWERFVNDLPAPLIIYLNTLGNKK